MVYTFEIIAYDNMTMIACNDGAKINTVNQEGPGHMGDFICLCDPPLYFSSSDLFQDYHEREEP